MFSMCSELTPCAPIPDTRIPQLMQPCYGASDKDQSANSANKATSAKDQKRQAGQTIDLQIGKDLGVENNTYTNTANTLITA